MFRKQRTGLVTSFACCLTLAAATTDTAHAWFERTITSRVMTPSNTGCVLQSSGMSHGDANSPFTIFNEALFRGVNATGSTCNNNLPVDTFKMIDGQFLTFLIKKNADGTPHDNYSVCSMYATEMLYGETKIEHRKEFSNAPCGAGWYAVVSCLLSASTVQVPPWIEGHFSAPDIWQCNVSPNWHPFSVGDGHSPGTTVEL